MSQAESSQPPKKTSIVAQVLIGLGQAGSLLLVLCVLVAGFIRLEARAQRRSQIVDSNRRQSAQLLSSTPAFLITQDAIEPSLLAVKSPSDSRLHKLLSEREKITSDAERKDWYRRMQMLPGLERGKSILFISHLVDEMKHGLMPADSVRVLLDVVPASLGPTLFDELDNDSEYIPHILNWLTVTEGNGSFSIHTVDGPRGESVQVKTRIGAEGYLPRLRDLISDSKNSQAVLEAIRKISPFDQSLQAADGEFVEGAMKLTTLGDLDTLRRVTPADRDFARYESELIKAIEDETVPIGRISSIAASWGSENLKEAILKKLEWSRSKGNLTIDNAYETLFALSTQFADPHIAKLFLELFDKQTQFEASAKAKRISVIVASTQIMSSNPKLFAERMIGNDDVAGFLLQVAARLEMWPDEMVVAFRNLLASEQSEPSTLLKWLAKNQLHPSARQQLRAVTDRALKEAKSGEIASKIRYVMASAYMADSKTVADDVSKLVSLNQDVPAISSLWLSLLIERFPSETLVAIGKSGAQIMPLESESKIFSDAKMLGKVASTVPQRDKPETWSVVDKAIATEVALNPALLSVDSVSKLVSTWGRHETLAFLRLRERTSSDSKLLESVRSEIESSLKQTEVRNE